MTWLWLTIAALIGLAAWIAAKGAGTYNRMMALDARCNTAFADIDVQLKHRANLIPGLVDTVKGFAGHEKYIVDAVTQANARALNAASPEEIAAADVQLQQSVGALLQSVRQIPDIKASPHFRNLEQQLIDAENRVTAARRFYNLAIEEYNTTLRQWPGSAIAAKRRLSTRQPYDLGIERVLIDEPVAISF
jgi:LemA protein